MPGVQAFLLTSHLLRRGDGQSVAHWASSEAGPLLLEHRGQGGEFFVEGDVPFTSPLADRRGTKLKNFAGKRVDALRFKNAQDLASVRDGLAARGARTYESDVRTPERFLMERFINGSATVVPREGERAAAGATLTDPELRPSSWRPNLSVLSLDIETGGDGSLYSAAFHQTDMRGTGGEKRLVLMVGDPGESGDGLVLVETERELLSSIVETFASWDPDCVVGWHVIGFDLAFLHRKFLAHGVPFSIGRGGGELRLSSKGSKVFASLPGRVVVDGPSALRAAFHRFEDFKLETVARELLGRGKDIAEAGAGKVAEIERRFREDKRLLAKYNLLDCELVTEIFRKTRLMDLLVTKSQVSGLLIDKLGFSVAAFDHFLLPRLHQRGFVASNVTESRGEDPSPGGHVFEPIAGIHENVVALDFKSLYPSIIRTFHIDPFSLMMAARPGAPAKDRVETPAGPSFSRRHHLLPEHLESLTEMRAKAAREGDAPLATAIKILMNSFYGVMGSKACRFHHAHLPLAIAGTGRWLLQEGRRRIEDTGREVIYGDTDSLFVRLSGPGADDPEATAGAIAEDVNAHLAGLLAERFRVESKCAIEFEGHYRKIFFPPSRAGGGAAKKKYAALASDPAGGTRLKLSGMESVRGDWTRLARDFQRELFERLFGGEGYEDISRWIKSLIARLRARELDDSLVYRKRITKDIKEYTKSVPPHIRAARMLGPSDGPGAPREVAYVHTTSGPVPVQRGPSDIDYQHYVDRQIGPLADGVLFVFDKSFKDVVEGRQLSLF